MFTITLSVYTLLYRGMHKVYTLEKGKHSVLTCSLGVEDYSLCIGKKETTHYKTYISQYPEYILVTLIT